jgi:DNA-binding transcriptional ArsR family regulator
MQKPLDRCDVLCLDIPKAEAARAALPASSQIEAWARGAQALADPTRLAIALALRECQPACVCDLGWITTRDEKLVSHHLRALRTAGLTSSRRQGKMVMYALTARGEALLEAIAAEVPA